MDVVEIGFRIGPLCTILSVQADTDIDNLGYERIRSTVASYPCVVDAQWLSAEGQQLLVTLQNSPSGDDLRRLEYYLVQIGVKLPRRTATPA